jgi:hypothetical protein
MPPNLPLILAGARVTPASTGISIYHFNQMLPNRPRFCDSELTSEVTRFLAMRDAIDLSPFDIWVFSSVWYRYRALSSIGRGRDPGSSDR